MKKVFLFAALAFITWISCKKEDSDPFYVDSVRRDTVSKTIDTVYIVSSSKVSVYRNGQLDTTLEHSAQYIDLYKHIIRNVTQSDTRVYRYQNAQKAFDFRYSTAASTVQY